MGYDQKGYEPWPLMACQVDRLKWTTLTTCAPHTSQSTVSPLRISYAPSPVRHPNMSQPVRRDSGRQAGSMASWG